MPTPRPILTLTGNLLAERTLEFGRWEIGKTHRAVRESFHARGKGVNVSNMLTRLGLPNTALIFAGGAAGAECEAWLRARGMDYRVFPTLQSSRTGTVIWSDTQPETTFLGPNIAPDADAVRACADFLDRQPPGTALALCGSFPGWTEPAFEVLRAALVRWTARSPLYVDVYGPPLEWLRRQAVELIKINRQEFDGLFPSNQRSTPVRERLLQLRRESPRSSWIVSDGPGTIWVMPADRSPVELQPPAVTEVSPTGSGDVLLAAILQARWHQGLDLVAAVKYALPYAAANAAHPGVADFPLPPRP